MCWWRSYKPVQSVIHKGKWRADYKVWQRNCYRRENRTGEGHAFQDASGSFEIALSIATGAARHVALIGHRYFGWRLRHEGCGSCREYGNRDSDHSDYNPADQNHSTGHQSGSAHPCHQDIPVANNHAPAATRTMPARRAIWRPNGVIFSKRMSNARRLIQSGFITPPTSNNVVIAQQQPTQYAP